MLRLSWQDIDVRLKKLNLRNVKVWGIPRGGSVVTGLAQQYGAIPVEQPTQADIGRFLFDYIS